MRNDEVKRLDAAAALKWLRSRLRSMAGRTLVAIDGVDGAGKTTFANELADLLRESGLEVIRISMDDYLNPQPVRWAQGRDSAKGYFEDSYDYQRFTDEVLEPLGHGGSGRYRTAAYDLGSESQVASPWRVAPDHAFVIIDGMFMHRDELCTSRSKKVWDLSVWLDVPFEESFLPHVQSRREAGSGPGGSPELAVLPRSVALPAELRPGLARRPCGRERGPARTHRLSCVRQGVAGPGRSATRLARP